MLNGDNVLVRDPIPRPDLPPVVQHEAAPRHHRQPVLEAARQRGRRSVLRHHPRPVLKAPRHRVRRSLLRHHPRPVLRPSNQRCGMRSPQLPQKKKRKCLGTLVCFPEITDSNSLLFISRLTLKSLPWMGLGAITALLIQVICFRQTWRLRGFCCCRKRPKVSRPDEEEQAAQEIIELEAKEDETPHQPVPPAVPHFFINESFNLDQ